MTVGIADTYLGIDLGTLGEFRTEIALVVEALIFTLVLAYLMRMAEKREVMALKEMNRLSNTTKQRLLTLIDEERTRIAGDLHDTAGQGIVLIANRLAGIARNARLSGNVQTQAIEVEALARNMLTEIRQISHDLHPAALDHLGLTGSLRELTENVAKASEIKVSLYIEHHDYRFSKNQSLQIFRIFQELLSNVVKHAGATATMARLTLNNQKCVLEVSDNGKGPRQQMDGVSGIGTDILNQRVDNLGGTIIWSDAKPGSSVVIVFPVGDKDQESRQ